MNTKETFYYSSTDFVRDNPSFEGIVPKGHAVEHNSEGIYLIECDERGRPVSRVTIHEFKQLSDT